MKKDRWGTPLILVAFVTGLVIPIIAIAFTQFPNKIFWQILSTVATFFAVCVSLYTANRPSKKGVLEVQNIRCMVRPFFNNENRSLAGQADGNVIPIPNPNINGQFDISLLCENSGELPIIITKITLALKINGTRLHRVNVKIPDNNSIKGKDARYLNLTVALDPYWNAMYWKQEFFTEKFESDFQESNCLSIELADGTIKDAKFDVVTVKKKIF